MAIRNTNSMDLTIFSNKIDILPPGLAISKDSLWQLINKISSVLVVDINDQTILFANPNSLKELRIIEQDSELQIASLLGKKFKYPITYGEALKLVLRTLDNYDALIEIRSSIVSWRGSPAYLLLINSYISFCDDCTRLRSRYDVSNKPLG